MPGRFAGYFGSLWRLVSHSLSSKLLLFTVIYVLISEVVIFFPSVGRYHRQILDTHVQAAELAVLPFTEQGSENLPDNLRQELLLRAEAGAVLLRRQGNWQVFLVSDMPESNGLTMIDLTGRTLWQDMRDAVDCLFAGGDRVLRVVAPTRIRDAQSIALILDENPIRADMLGYAGRTAVTSLFLSVMTAILVFFSLYLFLVRPMARLTRSIVSFRENPEDASRIVAPSNRLDEIGVAERELAAMQRDLYGSLQQKTRLAALGTAVARIQHDLRNILANAQLASDKLAESDDPVVKRLAPRLVGSIDRAVSLATRTLRYGRAAEPAPERRTIALEPLIVEAVEAGIAPVNSSIAVRTQIDAGLSAYVDSEQLFRIILNLVRNGAEAIALSGRDGTVRVNALRQRDTTIIDVCDTGPGISPTLREKLFQPFSTANKGGSGLGLAIARELARAHGGDVTLFASSSEGTVFRITLPDAGDI